MIRRTAGDEYWLITQNDHAAISGQLAREMGNSAFAPPSERATTAITLHDCGWPLHDDAPTLNKRGLPLDVFETPRDIGLKVWSESARRASIVDPYVGLLVSLHSLSLSILATTSSPITHERFDIKDARGRFEVNQFQHAQIELQESLRRQLGLSVEHPLRHGLAEDSPDPAEQLLAFDFRLLQAMDRLSLAICCTTPPIHVLEPLHTGPGASPISIRVLVAEQGLQLDRWPFRGASVDVEVPFRRLRSREFLEESEFHQAFAAARIEHFHYVIRPSHR